MRIPIAHCRSGVEGRCIGRRNRTGNWEERFQAMLLVQSHLDFPVNPPPFPRFLAAKNDCDRTAFDVVVTNSPPNVVWVVAIDSPFERPVCEDVKVGTELRNKVVVGGLIVFVMVTHENTRLLWIAKVTEKCVEQSCVLNHIDLHHSLLAKRRLELSFE